MKLAFKKTPTEKSLAGVARPGHRETSIKADGALCGQISIGWGSDQWSVRVAVNRTPTTEDPAPFEWVKFKTRFENEPAAREWVKSKWNEIEALGLHRLTET